MFAARRNGENRNGSQRYRCGECGATYSEASADRINRTNIPLPEVVKVVHLLVEGCSIRSIEHITGLHRDTILKLLVIVGEKCERLLDRMIVNVPVEEVECDEIWGFVGKKQKTLKPEDAPSSAMCAMKSVSSSVILVISLHFS